MDRNHREKACLQLSASSDECYSAYSVHDASRAYCSSRLLRMRKPGMPHAVALTVVKMRFIDFRATLFRPLLPVILHFDFLFFSFNFSSLCVFRGFFPKRSDGFLWDTGASLLFCPCFFYSLLVHSDITSFSVSFHLPESNLIYARTYSCLSSFSLPKSRIHPTCHVYTWRSFFLQFPCSFVSLNIVSQQQYAHLISAKLEVYLQWAA